MEESKKKRRFASYVMSVYVPYLISEYEDILSW